MRSNQVAGGAALNERACARSDNRDHTADNERAQVAMRRAASKDARFRLTTRSANNSRGRK